MSDFFKRMFSSVFKATEEANGEIQRSDSDEEGEITSSRQSRASRNAPAPSSFKMTVSDSDESSTEIQRKRNTKHTAKRKAKKDKLYNRHTRNPIESEHSDHSMEYPDSDTQKQLKLLEETKEEYNHLKTTVKKTMGQVDSLYCSICMEFIVECRTAICGHSFCQECIQESLIRKKDCPICRKDVRKWVQGKSEIIDQAVKMMVESKSDGSEDERDKYQTRLQNHKNWLKKHTVVNARPGQKLDVLDTEHIWCTAEVEIKILGEDRKPLLYLHYDGWSRKYDEYLYMESSRVAPKGVYTSRNDIPRYRMCQDHPNMMYANVIDSARQAQALANPDPQSSDEEAVNNQNAEDEAALAVEGIDENQEVPQGNEQEEQHDEFEEEEPEQQNFIDDNHVQQIPEELSIEQNNSLQRLESAFAEENNISRNLISGPNSLFNQQHRDSIRASGLPRIPLNASAPVSLLSPASNQQAEELQVEADVNQEPLTLQDNQESQQQEQQPTVAGTNNMITDDYFTAEHPSNEDKE